jgi:gluconolactonase
MLNRMRVVSFFIIGIFTATVSAQETIGTVEFLAPEMNDFFSSESKIEVLASGFSWAEGPFWVPQKQGLLFTDVPNNKVYLWNEKKGFSLFLNPSGMTNHAPHSTNEGANGLALDPDGNLILCQHGDRAVSMLKNWNSNRPEYEVLVDHYQNQWLNSPNDLAFDQEGVLFFTDPPYGLKEGDRDPLKALDFNGVYKWSLNTGIVLLDASLGRPNGIAFATDFKTLCIGNSERYNAVIIAFDYQNGTLVNKRVFFDGNALAQNRQGLFDGLKVHSSGIVFATGPGGVLVLDPKGKHLGTMRPGKSTANCSFDVEEEYLYLTSTNLLARIKLN